MRKFYLDGKCILSYDEELFSSDEDYYLIMENLIDPLEAMVYEKYYEKELVTKCLEQILKENEGIFQVYCGIKPLIEKEKISVEYLQEENETLFKKVMKEKLNPEDYVVFEKLLEKAGNVAWNEEMKFISSRDNISEHLWSEYCDE